MKEKYLKILKNIFKYFSVRKCVKEEKEFGEGKIFKNIKEYFSVRKWGEEREGIQRRKNI